MFTEARTKFLHHIFILVWKAYVQRQRRWRLLVLECAVGIVLFISACFVAKPVFLTPLQAMPELPLTAAKILESLPDDTILGYQPNTAPYTAIMERAAKLLHDKPMIAAASSQELDTRLSEIYQGETIHNKVIWVLWKEKEGNVHKFTIRSTELGREEDGDKNAHLTAGFLAVQMAVSQALLEHAVPNMPEVKISLEAMPGSPLMDKAQVNRVISLILMFFTLALLPPVLETEELMIRETVTGFKRALRLRDVDYSMIYLGWFSYAIMTALPMVFLGTIAMIVIFRWVAIITALLTLVTYACVMIVMSMIMSMYQVKGWVACTWTTLFTILQTFMAELMVHHHYDNMGEVPTFIFNLFLPPLGLVHALNQFALLQTRSDDSKMPVSGTLLSWWVLIIIYFLLLMLLQRTVGSERAIGGQQSWKSIIFKRAAKVKVKPVKTLTGKERCKLQPVDEFMAKAISFRNVNKSMMGVPVLSNLTFDIYRCEFSLLFAEINQKPMMNCLENLITGLTFADSGTVHVLGEELKPGEIGPLNMPQMMGYCHQSHFLVEDFTVQEHLTMFMDICLWHVSEHRVMQYSRLRFKRLLQECNLEEVKFVLVRNLDYYYRAQLCWALATLLEPKVIVMTNFIDHPIHMAVMRDKIIRYKEFVSVVKIGYSNIELDNADRVFVFDHQRLSFGGTPAYMFFKFGREYRLHLSLKSGSAVDDSSIHALLSQAEAAGATVRSHMGSMLILRIPTNPTARVAEFIRDLEEKCNEYGITSMNLTLPDSEEIFRRSLYESRPAEQRVSRVETNDALRRLAGDIGIHNFYWRIFKEEPRRWKITNTKYCNMTHFKQIAWKYYSFYANYKSSLVINIVAAALAGIIIGITLGHLLKDMIGFRAAVHGVNIYNNNMLSRLGTTHKHVGLGGQLLTVEAWMNEGDTHTTLVLRVQDHEDALDLARGYVLSEVHASPEQVYKMTYTALKASESLTEYLVTKAIDSPENYVYLYAYGMDVAVDNGIFTIKVLYSPMHHDRRGAARSLARAYTALLRYYTKQVDASIQVTDYPLVVELTPWMVSASKPPLLIQFLLVLTVAHITLVPSNEYGLVRHFQSHARNFSPARYWFSLLFCDVLYYLLLVGVMCAGIFGMVIIIVPMDYFVIWDLCSVPFMLVMYGLATIPQAYLFSLGSRPALNSMTYSIVNVVFGEATIMARLLVFEGLEETATDVMVISPQYNMALGLVKIQTTFLYNNECWIFDIMEHMCAAEILNMCCEKCGILQDCYEKKSYLYTIRHEVNACIVCSVLFMSLLLLWEYMVLQRAWRYLQFKCCPSEKIMMREIARSVFKPEIADALDKERQIRNSKKRNSYDSRIIRRNTFGEYLLALNVSYKKNKMFLVNDVYLALGKGQVLAISGLKRHGRLRLCELLAGIRMPSHGRLWAMSNYQLNTEPHMYRRNVTICSGDNPLPGWMRVGDALRMVAILRGVPKKHVPQELNDLIEALDFTAFRKTQITSLPSSCRKRLNFAAAVIGAPPVIVLDECTAYQPYSVRRAMYHIVYCLREFGHSIVISDSNVEANLAVASRLAILRDGRILDTDHVERLVRRYSKRGYTVVMHLKDDLDVGQMSSKYFNNFVINDISEVLVNMQVLDQMSWSRIFQKMEQLKAENTKVYSYIICATPIAYIYQSILADEAGMTPTREGRHTKFIKSFFCQEPKVMHTEEQIAKLKKFVKKYDITTLRELPWSVIFQT